MSLPEMMSFKNKTNIAFFIDFLTDKFGASGGTERQVYELLCRLDSEKNDIYLFCLRENKDSTLWKNLNVTKHNLQIESLLSLKAFFSILRVVKILRSKQIDIVQTFFQDSNIFGVMASKLAGVKVTISCRRDLGFWSNSRINKTLSMLNKFTDHHLVNSQSVKTAFVENERVKSGKITIIHNGIDVSFLDALAAANLNEEFPTLSSDDQVVGIVANFTRKVKRLDLFIEAASEVVKNIEKVKFLIIGGGNLEPELRRQVKELGLEKHVIFAGVREQPVRYMKSFNVGVLCSDSEGFSNTLMEYMVAGIPAVATSVGGNQEIIEDQVTGLLVPPDDSIKLAEGMLKILNNPELGMRLGLKGREFIKGHYDWDRVVQTTQDFYSDILGETEESKGERFPIR